MQHLKIAACILHPKFESEHKQESKYTRAPQWNPQWNQN